MISERRLPLAPVRQAHPGALTAKFFRGLGDATRVRVLRLLEDGERTVSELRAVIGIEQGRLSSHLACLRWCGFVATRRDGRRVYYSLRDPRVLRLLTLADEFLDEHGDHVDVCRVVARELAPARGAHPEQEDCDDRTD